MNKELVTYSNVTYSLLAVSTLKPIMNKELVTYSLFDCFYIEANKELVTCSLLRRIMNKDLLTYSLFESYFKDLELNLMFTAPLPFLFQTGFPFPFSFLFSLQFPPSLPFPLQFLLLYQVLVVVCFFLDREMKLMFTAPLTFLFWIRFPLPFSLLFL